MTDTPDTLVGTIIPETCTRCGGPGRTIPAYWNDAERYCPACCTTIAAEHDVAGSWPPRP